MSKVDRDEVRAQLRAEDVAQHLGITGQWRGRWMHARRCGQTDHGSDAFALARDGMWHCHSCDQGGDLLKLLAIGEGLDIKADFPKVLEIAAGLAGIDLDPGADLFGTGPVRPPPRARPEAPPLPPLRDRIATARKRAAWAWERLHDETRTPEVYLRSRGLDPAVVLAREVVRCTPLRMSQADLVKAARPGDLRTLWRTMGTQRGTLSVVVKVRSVIDGEPVDLRARRVDPEDGKPKIIGMVGGVTSAPAEPGKTRQLIGCYGRPHSIDSDHVVIVEGLMDYLTALQVWPNAEVLGAVEAGSLALVTAWAAAALAARDSTSRLTIVEQADPPRIRKSDGKLIPGAADQSINEDPNAATKVAIRLLRSPKRVGWLFCDSAVARAHGGSDMPVKDLNDLVRSGANIASMLTWWTDLASNDG